jgi:hypothetical protein
MTTAPTWGWTSTRQIAGFVQQDAGESYHCHGLAACITGTIAPRRFDESPALWSDKWCSRSAQF